MATRRKTARRTGNSVSSGTRLGVGRSEPGTEVPAKGFAVEGSEQDLASTDFPSTARVQQGAAQRRAMAMNKTETTVVSETGSTAGDEHEYEAGSSFDMSYWVGYAQDRVRAAAEVVSVQVQEHPFRTLAIAGALGFVIGTTLRHRALPTILRSALGVAAAMALREFTERGMTDIGTMSEPVMPHAQAEE